MVNYLDNTVSNSLLTGAGAEHDGVLGWRNHDRNAGKPLGTSLALIGIEITALFEIVVRTLMAAITFIPLAFSAKTQRVWSNKFAKPVIESVAIAVATPLLMVENFTALCTKGKTIGRNLPKLLV